MLNALYGGMTLRYIDDAGRKAGDVARGEVHGYLWERDVHTTASQLVAHCTAVQGFGFQAQEAQIRFLVWQQEKRQIVQYLAKVCLVFRALCVRSTSNVYAVDEVDVSSFDEESKRDEGVEADDEAGSSG